MIPTSSHLVQLAEAKLETKIEQAQPLTQGDLSETFLITTAEEQTYVIKNGFSPLLEKKMLAILEKHQIHVPQQIYADQHILILEFISETNSFSNESWLNLGDMLTLMHKVRNKDYGWDKDYAFGKVSLNNTPLENWVEFWGEQRLGCYLSHLPPVTAKKIEKLIKHLNDHLPMYPAPSLLHGDLWTGNILNHGNQPYLIDPACYFGHNEVDIAMLNLFGSPSDIFYQSYKLLEPDWQTRLPIYQLFPLIVHYILFGDYYLRMIEHSLQKMKL